MKLKFANQYRRRRKFSSKIQCNEHTKLLLYFKEGKEAGRSVGVQDKEENKGYVKIEIETRGGGETRGRTFCSKFGTKCTSPLFSPPPLVSISIFHIEKRHFRIIFVP